MKLFILALGLAGCATDPVWWTKPGFETTQFRQDDYQCVKDANETRWGTAAVLYRQCMTAKGYRETTAPTP